MITELWYDKNSVEIYSIKLFFVSSDELLSQFQKYFLHLIAFLFSVIVGHKTVNVKQSDKKRKLTRLKPQRLLVDWYKRNVIRCKDFNFV